MALDKAIDALQSQLLSSGLQKRDNPLYQVIEQLIRYLRTLNADTNTAITIVDSALKNATYVTYTNQLANLPFSRLLTAGTNITLDVSTPGQIIINASGGGGDVEWSVLTNGDATNPELIFAGGDVIMTHIP